MQPFKPSRLSTLTTAIVSRDQGPEPSNGIVLVGDRPVDRRNPMLKTDAEVRATAGSAAHFMAHRDPGVRESAKYYEVLPGGQTVYFRGAEQKLVPYSPDDIPERWTLCRVPTANLLDKDKGTDQPRTGLALSFPEDRAFAGHNTTVSVKLRGRHGI